MKRRLLFFVLAIAAGVGLGLVYGWLVNPVQYVDTNPDTLRSDYKADVVLMVAETYQAEGNLTQAVSRLTLLGDSPPLNLVQEAIVYAGQAQYPTGDIDRLLRLSQALQAWSPTPGGNP